MFSEEGYYVVVTIQGTQIRLNCPSIRGSLKIRIVAAYGDGVEVDRKKAAEACLKKSEGGATASGKQVYESWGAGW
jgi:hypothetical protein